MFHALFGQNVNFFNQPNQPLLENSILFIFFLRRSQTYLNPVDCLIILGIKNVSKRLPGCNRQSIKPTKFDSIVQVRVPFKHNFIYYYTLKKTIYLWNRKYTPASEQQEERNTTTESALQHRTPSI